MNSKGKRIVLGITIVLVGVASSWTGFACNYNTGKQSAMKISQKKQVKPKTPPPIKSEPQPQSQQPGHY